MKLIQLTQKQFAIVDDEDFERLNQWKWCASYDKRSKRYYTMRHANMKGKTKTIYMHRLVLGLKSGDRLETDHVNHNTLDNRRNNLRKVTHGQNQWNREKTKGYCWDKKEKKWIAQISVNKQHKRIGAFETGEEARQAYITAKERYHTLESYSNL